MDNQILRLHRENAIVDSHLDLGMDIFQQRSQGKKQILLTEHLNEIKAGHVNVIGAAVFLDNWMAEIAPTRFALEQIGAIYADVAESHDMVAVCRTYEESQQAIAKDQLALVLALEGAEPVGQSPELLYGFYAMGVRILGLAWSRRNLIADGALYTTPTGHVDSGLTDIGKEIVKTASSLGMIIDITHLCDACSDDVFQLATGPVIASHSNCRQINPTKRNLSDIHIKRIAESGGVVCMNSVSAIVSDQAGGATMQTLLDHFDHVRDLVGTAYLGLGFDFSKRVMDAESRIIVNGFPQPVFDIVNGYQQLSALTEALLQRDYTESDIAGIYGGNMMRVFRNTLREK